MNPVLRNIIGVIVGVVIGSMVNMGIIMISGSIIPPPEGSDVTTMEGLEASMPLFSPRHFIFPFLAHALGTFVGALIAASIAASHKMHFAIGIGIFFLLGGLANVFMLPSPIWYSVLDLGLAYIPMAWLGGTIAQKRGMSAS